MVYDGTGDFIPSSSSISKNEHGKVMSFKRQSKIFGF